MMAPSPSPLRLVILNDIDAPNVSMVALVRRSRKGLVWEYVCARPHRGAIKWKPVQWEHHFTDLATFGVMPVIEGGLGVLRLAVERTGQSAALYPDGKPRAWQGHIEQSCRVRPGMVDHLMAFMMQSKESAA